MLVRWMIWSLRFYQLWLSPVLARWVQCRYHPTCSEYAILSFQKYGFASGARKTWRRLRRCTPYSLDSCLDYP